MRWLLVLLLGMGLPAAHADEATDTYLHACAWCHGETGRGDGAATLSLWQDFAPRPRDFTRGKFKLRSTPSGKLPTDADLLRTVERGIPRYMPAFSGLTATERQLAVVAVKRFFPGFATAPPAPPLTIPSPPPADAAAAERGATLYRDAGCPACHGDQGRGDGSAAKDLRDGRGGRLAPANLRRPEMFKNGATAEDLYRTLVTGLDDTPMASYSDALTPAQRWDVIAFLRALGDARD